MSDEWPSIVVRDAAAIVDALTNWHAVRGAELFDRMEDIARREGRASPGYAAEQELWNLHSTACDALKVVRAAVKQQGFYDESARVEFFKALQGRGEDHCIPRTSAARAGLD